MKVIIPCHNRPEFLKICLDHVIKADESQLNEYVFAFEFGADKKNIDIIVAFPFKNKVIVNKQNIYDSKISFNVFNALLDSCDSELICYIEDDIFIGKDFFTMAKRIHEQEPDIFEVILSKNMNSNDPIIDNPDAYYVKENTNNHQYYGNCIKSKMFCDFMSIHFRDEYFKDTSAYVAEQFSESTLNNAFSELDGLTRRVIEKHKLKVAFTHVPRCFHAGFVGVHRKINVDYDSMTFDEKINFINEYAFDYEKLKTIVLNPAYAEDSKPVNLLTSHNNCIKV